jgi:hypothetical protein
LQNNGVVGTCRNKIVGSIYLTDEFRPEEKERQTVYILGNRACQEHSGIYPRAAILGQKGHPDIIGIMRKRDNPPAMLTFNVLRNVYVFFDIFIVNNDNFLPRIMSHNRFPASFHQIRGIVVTLEPTKPNNIANPLCLGVIGLHPVKHIFILGQIAISSYPVTIGQYEIVLGEKPAYDLIDGTSYPYFF